MSRTEGWPALFASAFGQSRNAMLLVDAGRIVVDANAASVQLLGRPRDELVGRPTWEFVEGGPIVSEAEWRETTLGRRSTGTATMLHADGSRVRVQWGATPETVTGRRLVLFVSLSTSRWGAHFRRGPDTYETPRSLSVREREIVRLVATGATGPEIADELHLSHETVRTHVRNAMTKVGARSRAHLVAKAVADDTVLGRVTPTV